MFGKKKNSSQALDTRELRLRGAEPHPHARDHPAAGAAQGAVACVHDDDDGTTEEGHGQDAGERGQPREAAADGDGAGVPLAVPVLHQPGRVPGVQPVPHRRAALPYLICFVACVFFSFTDSFVGADGKLYYGLATAKGLLVFNYTGDDSGGNSGGGC